MATEIENETKYTPGQRAYSVHLLKFAGERLWLSPPCPLARTLIYARTVIRSTRAKQPPRSREAELMPSMIATRLRSSQPIRLAQAYQAFASACFQSSFQSFGRVLFSSRQLGVILG